jgi:hypothetical protein
MLREFRKKIGNFGGLIFLFHILPRQIRCECSKRHGFPNGAELDHWLPPLWCHPCLANTRCCERNIQARKLKPFNAAALSSNICRQGHISGCMSAVVLGGEEFDENCEEIDVRWRDASGAEVAVLGKRMAAGKFRSLRILNLVCRTSFECCVGL